jgi:hypothetical protein
LDVGSPGYKRKLKYLYQKFKKHYESWVEIYKNDVASPDGGSKKSKSMRSLKKKQFVVWIVRVFSLLNVHLLTDYEKIEKYCKTKCDCASVAYASFYEKIKETNESSSNKKRKETFISFVQRDERINESVEARKLMSKDVDVDDVGDDDDDVNADDRSESNERVELQTPNAPELLPLQILKKCLSGEMTFASDMWYPSTVNVEVLRTTAFQKDRDALLNNMGGFYEIFDVAGNFRIGKMLKDLAGLTNKRSDKRNSFFSGRQFSDGDFDYWVLFETPMPTNDVNRLKKHFDLFDYCVKTCTTESNESLESTKAFTYSTEYTMFVARTISNAQRLATMLLQNVLSWHTTHDNSNTMLKILNEGGGDYTALLTTIKHKHHNIKKTFEKNESLRLSCFKKNVLPPRIKNTTFDGGLTLFIKDWKKESNIVAVNDIISKSQNHLAFELNNKTIADYDVTSEKIKKMAETNDASKEKNASSVSSSSYSSDWSSSSSSSSDDDTSKETRPPDEKQKHVAETSEEARVVKDVTTMITESLVSSESLSVRETDVAMKKNTETSTIVDWACANQSESVIVVSETKTTDSPPSDLGKLFRLANSDVIITSPLRSERGTKFNTVFLFVPNVVWFNEPELRSRIFGVKYHHDDTKIVRNLLDPLSERPTTADVDLQKDAMIDEISQHATICWPTCKRADPDAGESWVVFRDDGLWDQRREFYKTK